MRLTRLRRLWLVVAASSLLTTPAYASDVLSFLCQYDLVARPRCCCAGGHERGTVGAGEGASVSPACCCRVLRTDARAARTATAPSVVSKETAKVLLPAANAPMV